MMLPRISFRKLTPEDYDLLKWLWVLGCLAVGSIFWALTEPPEE